MIINLRCRGWKEIIHEVLHPDHLGEKKIIQPQELKDEFKDYIKKCERVISWWIWLYFFVFALILILILPIGFAIQRLVKCLFDCLKNKWYMLNKVEVNLITSIKPSLNSYICGGTYGGTQIREILVFLNYWF